MLCTAYVQPYSGHNTQILPLFIYSNLTNIHIANFLLGQSVAHRTKILQTIFDKMDVSHTGDLTLEQIYVFGKHINPHLNPHHAFKMLAKIHPGYGDLHRDDLALYLAFRTLQADEKHLQELAKRFNPK